MNKKSMIAIKVRKSIRIAAHNINRLKGNRHKLEILIDKLNEEDYDMIGVIETNILEKKSQYITRNQENIDSF